MHCAFWHRVHVTVTRACCQGSKVFARSRGQFCFLLSPQDQTLQHVVPSGSGFMGQRSVVHKPVVEQGDGRRATHPIVVAAVYVLAIDTGYEGLCVCGGGTERKI